MIISLVHYTKSGGADQAALAIVTVDSPKIILAADPLYALVEFFMSAFPPADPADVPEFEPIPETDDDDKPVPTTPAASPLAFRVEVISSTILILASDSQSDSQAIQLTVEQLLMSQQGILALNIQKVGMALLAMDKPNETVRFLDEIDLTLSIDSRRMAQHQMTDIELAVQPIIFRASYRDIMLITEIVNKAIALSSRPSPLPAADESAVVTDEGASSLGPSTVTASRRRNSRVSRGSIGASPVRARSGARRSTVTRNQAAKPKIILSKEHVRYPLLSPPFASTRV